MSRRGMQADEMVPLAERIRAVSIYRAVVAVALVMLQVHAGRGLGEQLGWTGAYLGISALLSVPVLTQHRALALHSFGISLLVDGIYLQVERLLSHPVGLDVVIAMYLSAVCLLASFRTGVKIAIWQTLLVFMFRQAALLSVFGVGKGKAIGQAELLAYLSTLWVAVIATAMFAALNERELRRRRYDAEALRRFAIGLGGAVDPADVESSLLDFVTDELQARRVAWLVVTPEGLEVVAGRDIALDAGPINGISATNSELLQKVTDTSAGVVLRPSSDDVWLDSLFPGGRRLIVLRLPHGDGHEGYLVLEHRGRGSRLERRVLSTASQACAAVVLAHGRASVLTQLRSAANTDGLTGAYNRRAFDDQIRRLGHNPEGPLAVLIVDVDHFKNVNDTHGHQVGDQVLQSVSAALRRSARSEDFVARYGGEEFVVLMRHTDRRTAQEVGERLRAQVQAQSEPVPVTISVGVATSLTGADDLNALIAKADAALYRAKTEGRNRVVMDGMRLVA